MDFKKILESIQLALQLAAVVEQLIPGSGKGKEKLAFVLKSVGDAMGNIQSIEPLITAILGRFVATANATGTFVSSKPAT